MGGYSVGVDLGGTNFRVAAVDEDGIVLQRISASADYEQGPEKLIGDIIRVINNIREPLGSTSLRGVGVGLPGFVDSDTGVVMSAANLPGFQGYPIRDEIQRYLGIPIILENDANAAALGEMWMGAGRDVKDLMLMTLGTGIGGGIVIDGKVLHGFRGMAGEIGHMTVYSDGNPCGCGNNGCLEKHASATAIAAMGRMLFLGRDVTAAKVYQLAKEGNKQACLIFESMGKALGIALANFVNIFNFPLYLISGGPVPAWDFFAPAMFAEISKRSFSYRLSPARIEKALLGADAGLFGAAYLPFQKTALKEATAGSC